VVFFGDGAMEEGVFSETLNIAQLWRVPLVFFMENNSVSPEERSGRGSPTSEHSASALSDVPRAYGIATQVVDGSDVEAVYAASCHAVEAARSGGGPFFIESRTSRWPGSFGSSPTLSPGGETDLAWAWSPELAAETVRGWVERSDPVLLYARRLLDGGTPRDQLVALDSSVTAEIASAVTYALNSREPSPASATEFTFAPAR
jgi:TPP-dependent pyruvate/acetoin dehydrogenase alpha subunit